MVFLHGIDKASREQLLDLLCFMEGPDILSIVKDTLNRLLGKVPILKDKIDVNLLQKELDFQKNRRKLCFGMLHRDRAHARRCCTRSTILSLCNIPKQNLLRCPPVGWSVCLVCLVAAETDNLPAQPLAFVPLHPFSLHAAAPRTSSAASRRGAGNWG